MAGRGFPSSGKRSRERDQKRLDAEFEQVKDDGARHGPDLPDVSFVLGRGEDAFVVREWPERTLAWWETWRCSPQAQVFTATDWDYLIDTARAHAEYWYGINPKAISEVRLRVAQFGATPADRLRLRMSVGGPKVPGTTAQPKPESDDEVAVKRRERLGKAAGE